MDDWADKAANEILREADDSGWCIDEKGVADIIRKHAPPTKQVLFERGGEWKATEGGELKAAGTLEEAYPQVASTEISKGDTSHTMFIRKPEPADVVDRYVDRFGYHLRVFRMLDGRVLAVEIRETLAQ